MRIIYKAYWYKREQLQLLSLFTRFVNNLYPDTIEIIYKSILRLCTYFHFHILKSILVNTSFEYIHILLIILKISIHNIFIISININLKHLKFIMRKFPTICFSFLDIITLSENQFLDFCSSCIVILIFSFLL